MSKLELKVNGKSYVGWQSITLKRSMGAISGGFGLGIVRAWSGDIYPSDKCLVTIDGEPIISGFIDNVNFDISDSDNSFSVEGRDFTGQLVDCSAIYKTGSWTKARLDKIVNDLILPFKIVAKFEVQNFGSVFRKFTIQQGETVFECIDRLCKSRGLIATSNFKGELVITDGKPKKSTDSLVLGVNVKSANMGLKLENRHSKYIVKGSAQLANDDWWEAKSSYSFSGECTDESVKLYRPLIIIPDSQSDAKMSQTRANYEASIRAAKSSAVKVTVVGWRQKDGKLWDVNLEIPVKIPTFGFDETLLIVDCDYSLDDSGGEIVSLNLMRKDAFLKMSEKKVLKKRESGFKW